ncbi:hypothetical protein ACWDKQ_35410 [Saccharopolyspora sp. NPDC000995]
MRSNPNRGRIYRRCGCRDQDHRQLGPHCPKLDYHKHRTWAFAVDLPSITGRRRTLRRSGFTTRAHAQTELNRILGCERTGVAIDDRETIADYLTDWLATKALTLKPTTMARYTDYLTKTASPPSARSGWKNSATSNVAQFVRTQLDAGRGPITLRRCVATLSSALNDAVHQRRLTQQRRQVTKKRMKGLEDQLSELDEAQRPSAS